MTISAELKAKILRYYFVKHWRVGTIARSFMCIIPLNFDEIRTALSTTYSSLCEAQVTPPTLHDGAAHRNQGAVPPG